MSVKMIGDIIDGWNLYLVYQVTTVFLGILTIVVEAVLLKYLLKWSWKESAKISLIINVVSVAIGFLLRLFLSQVGIWKAINSLELNHLKKILFSSITQLCNFFSIIKIGWSSSMDDTTSGDITRIIPHKPHFF